MTQLPEERDDTAKGVDEPSPQTPGRRPADTFAVRLLLARHLNGMTISEAAQASGLNDATWSTWEGGRKPRDLLDVCQRIAEALDVDVQWLIFGGALSPSAPPRRVTKRPGEATLRYPLVTVRSGMSERAHGAHPVSRPASGPRNARPAGRAVAGPRPGQPAGPEQRRPVRISSPNAARPCS